MLFHLTQKHHNYRCTSTLKDKGLFSTNCFAVYCINLPLVTSKEEMQLQFLEDRMQLHTLYQILSPDLSIGLLSLGSRHVSKEPTNTLLRYELIMHFEIVVISSPPPLTFRLIDIIWHKCHTISSLES